MKIEGAVEALTIIEGFDVIEDGGPGLGMGGEMAAIDEFEPEVLQKLSMAALS